MSAGLFVWMSRQRMEMHSESCELEDLLKGALLASEQYTVSCSCLHILNSYRLSRRRRHTRF